MSDKESDKGEEAPAVEEAPVERELPALAEEQQEILNRQLLKAGEAALTIGKTGRDFWERQTVSGAKNKCAVHIREKVKAETRNEGEGDAEETGENKEEESEGEPALPTLSDTVTHIPGPAEWVVKELQRRTRVKAEAMELPNWQHDITQNIAKWKNHQKKHELKHQIKNMHLRENALLKTEMQEKLEELEKLESELGGEDLAVRNKLGLVGDEDVRKKTLKQRLHMSEEEEKQAKEEAEKRVHDWEEKMKALEKKREDQRAKEAEKAKAREEKLAEERKQKREAAIEKRKQ